MWSFPPAGVSSADGAVDCVDGSGEQTLELLFAASASFVEELVCSQGERREHAQNAAVSLNSFPEEVLIDQKLVMEHVCRFAVRETAHWNHQSV